MRKVLPFIIVFFLSVSSCATHRKIHSLRSNATGASLNLPDESFPDTLEWKEAERDTFRIRDEEGKEILIMKAVRDENGEMVATDEIQAAYVTARFRNVAERHSEVELRFQINVPAAMQDQSWQVRLFPRMEILSDTTYLESVIITGREYRKAQLRGYQQYEKFLSSIVSDSASFIRIRDLELFLKRNIPAVFAFKSDSSYVSDEVFTSAFGITEQEAMRHYTRDWLVRNNRRKIKSKDRMYQRYIKVPISSEGVRLDTVLAGPGGDFTYEYIQTIPTRAKLKSVSLTIEGDIFEEDRHIYSIPRSEDIRFYISSVSSFVDETPRYKTMVIPRRVSANTTCDIAFHQGENHVDSTLGRNAEEIARICDYLDAILANEEFDLDSIMVTATSSPEGTFAFNEKLSLSRSSSVAGFFDSYVAKRRGSRAHDIMIDENGNAKLAAENDIRFRIRTVPEDWNELSRLVREDHFLTEMEKERFASLLGIEDPDLRENEMKKEKSYTYISTELYPRTRRVTFDFQLHRKGMVQDTVLTTTLDTLYMNGVQAIKDRDYKKAISILAPYRDFNAAVAFCALDYNASAMEILKDLRKEAPVNYMLAILYSRMNDDRNAVQHFMNACAQDASLRFRGNLDPEISQLIKKYGLNNEEYDDTD